VDKNQLSKIKSICNMSNLDDLQASLSASDTFREPQRRSPQSRDRHLPATHSQKEFEGFTT
jgi:hypothetical protein